MGFDIQITCDFLSEGLIGEKVFENIDVFVDKGVEAKSKSFIYYTG